MQDDRIVTLYWQRDESAIRETEKRYGQYLLKIAYHILSDWEDSKESVNDTYLKAWHSMPPHRPSALGAYMGKITRQVSIDLFRTRSRKKRRPSEYLLSLSELEECVSGGDTTGQGAELHLLAQAIGTYLCSLPPQARIPFVGRYFYADPVREIAAYCGASESKIKSILYRTRQGLRAYLKQEGFEL